MFPVLNFERMNEADIRAEVIDPLLRRLGYQSGTEFNIERERFLRYPQRSLGRRKKSDPALTGKADYILEIRGIDRWTIEAKPPLADISEDDVYQAYSYANHPEIAASYFVLCNGRRFAVYRTISGPAAEPILAFSYDEFNQRIQVLENLLGPDSFRRSLLANHIDTGRPLIKGLPSTLDISAGEIEYFEVAANHPVAEQKIHRMIGVRLPIAGGFIWRLENQIAVKVRQGFVHKQQEAGRASKHGRDGVQLFFKGRVPFNRRKASQHIRINRVV